MQLVLEVGSYVLNAVRIRTSARYHGYGAYFTFLWHNAFNNVLPDPSLGLGLACETRNQGLQNKSQSEGQSSNTSVSIRRGRTTDHGKNWSPKHRMGTVLQKNVGTAERSTFRHPEQVCTSYKYSQCDALPACSSRKWLYLRHLVCLHQPAATPLSQLDRCHLS